MPLAFARPIERTLRALPDTRPVVTLPPMTDVQVTTAERDTRPSRPLRVSGKLKDACDYLVHEGMSLYEAARKAEISTYSMREALKKRHVLAYLRQQRDILRESMCGANILALADVRDQTDNQNARVSAVKALEQLAEDNSPARSNRSAMVTMPGLVIQIVQAVDTQPAILRHEAANPLISHETDILPENVDR